MQRTLGPEAKIVRLENGGASEDGLKVMFDIVTTDDKLHPFWMADNDLEKFVIYVIGLSQHAAGASGKLAAPEGSQTQTTAPIEALAVGVDPGRVAGEGLLTLNLGTFVLSFALPTNTLQQLHTRLGAMLRPTEPPKSN